MSGSLLESFPHLLRISSAYLPHLYCIYAARTSPALFSRSLWIYYCNMILNYS